MCYGFLVKEIDYENKENEEVTINSFGERTAAIYFEVRQGV